MLRTLENVDPLPFPSTKILIILVRAKLVNSQKNVPAKNYHPKVNHEINSIIGIGRQIHLVQTPQYRPSDDPLPTARHPDNHKILNKFTLENT